MVHASHGVVVERHRLEASGRVVLLLVDARESSDAQPRHVDDARCAQVEHVGGHPTSVVQLLQVARGFVVAADEHGEHGRRLLLLVVAVEGVQRAVLGRTRQRVQVAHVAHALEVAAAQQQLHGVLRVHLVDEVDGRVDVVQQPVGAAHHRDAHHGDANDTGAPRGLGGFGW